MEFTKDDLRVAYKEGHSDGFICAIEKEHFEENDFDVWFEFVFKDRLDEEQAYCDTQAEIWRQKLLDAENPFKTSGV